MFVLITGGTKGIGRAVAEDFAERGAEVALNYLRDDAAATSAKTAIEKSGGRAHTIRTDVGTPQGCRTLIEALQPITKRVDLIVHGAVDPYAGELLTANPERLERAVVTNGLSLLYLAQAARPLLDRGSSIAFLSSRGGRVVIANYAAVGVGKALAESLLRYMAVELAPKGIRINAVAPGIVETDAVRTIFGDGASALVAGAGAANPSGRNVLPRDYANLIWWLASPEAEYVTGQVISVNGGANLSA